MLVTNRIFLSVRLSLLGNQLVAMVAVVVRSVQREEGNERDENGSQAGCRNWFHDLVHGAECGLERDRRNVSTQVLSTH